MRPCPGPPGVAAAGQMLEGSKLVVGFLCVPSLCRGEMRLSQTRFESEDQNRRRCRRVSVGVLAAHELQHARDVLHVPLAQGDAISGGGHVVILVGQRRAALKERAVMRSDRKQKGLKLARRFVLVSRGETRPPRFQ